MGGGDGAPHAERGTIVGAGTVLAEAGRASATSDRSAVAATRAAPPPAAARRNQRRSCRGRQRSHMNGGIPLGRAPPHRRRPAVYGDGTSQWWTRARDSGPQRRDVGRQRRPLPLERAVRRYASPAGLPSGPGLDCMVTTFASLGVPPALAKALAATGIEEPFPIHHLA